MIRSPCRTHLFISPSCIARRARQVGICLKHLPSNSNSNNDNDDNDDNVSGHTYHHFHSDNVPWQRVINSKGMISHR
jgi:methylated-DNA-protein-cysteine methyltransferase related protein